MAQRISRKAWKQDDMVVEAGFDAVSWIEAHRRETIGAVAGVIVLALAIVGWSAWSRSRDNAARQQLADALALYQEGIGTEGAPAKPESLQKALPLFEKAMGSGVDEVATFYAGATQLRLGQAEAAATRLEELSTDADSRVLSDNAKALAAEAYERAGKPDKAVAIYRELAEAEGGVFPRDLALLRAGDVLQKEGKAAEATQAWRDVLARFPEGSARADAQIRLGPAEGGPPPLPGFPPEGFSGSAP